MSYIAKTSKRHFDSGYGCAEAVLLAIAEHYNIKSDFIPGIATGFCGGCSNTNGMCGAVSGGILAINLTTGRQSADQSKSKNQRAVREFIQWFKQRFGDTNCTELSGYDLSTIAGSLSFDAHKKCGEFVGESAEKVLSIIEEIKEK